MKIKDFIKNNNITKITILYNCNYKNGVECVDFDTYLLEDRLLNRQIINSYVDEFNRNCVVI